MEIGLNRMAPLVSLQKKVYVSILRKELPKLLAFASGATNTQSLQNIVREFLLFFLILEYCCGNYSIVVVSL